MSRNKLTQISIGLLGLWLAPAVYAGGMIAPVEGIDADLLGVAVGVAPDYYGSDDNSGGVGLIGRYQFKGTERFILLLGPLLEANLLNDSHWRAGPIIRYRFARDDQVDDSVVKQMDKVDSTFEGGVFIDYKLPLSTAPMHQIVFGGDVEGGSNGTEGHLRMTYWQPFSRTLLGTVGLGMTYGNDEFMKNYFGVTSAHDIALYPSLGGSPYQASSGVVGWNIPFGLTTFLSKEWLLSAGGRYEKLVGDAKDSPVVSQRGSDNQWVAGVALTYVFY